MPWAIYKCELKLVIWQMLEVFRQGYLHAREADHNC
jgi:hypothetical protein